MLKQDQQNRGDKVKALQKSNHPSSNAMKRLGRNKNQATNHSGQKDIKELRDNNARLKTDNATYKKTIAT